MMKPDPRIHLTVVLDRAEAVYSGMVPGLVAGDYSADQLEIDVVPLARRARARVILSAARRIDADAQRIELTGRPDISYDLASLDVGATVRGLELPGVREHTISTRPIRTFVDLIERALVRVRAASTQRVSVAVIGTGTAGVELAFTIEARLKREGVQGDVTLVGEAATLLPGASGALCAAAEAEAERRGITIRRGDRVVRADADAIHLEDGTVLRCDLALWATGAAPGPLIHSSRLPKDAGGFVRIDPRLRVEGRENLFAVGDCATLTEEPWVPKAGVYAVRQGPVLEHNLRAASHGHSLRRYQPQRDFLSLLNLGGARALGSKWNRVASGRAVWLLKDRIDRHFVRRFRVLEQTGALASAFPDPASMGMEEMPCGGCAAKLGPSPLERALGRVGAPPPDDSVVLGLGARDDAAAMRTPSGDVILATVDAFRAFTDDPWLVGRVAAVNAVSDILAKGGRPRHALALVTLPEDSSEHSEELLFQVLAGIRAALDPLGVSLVGGHTTTGAELFVGLSVTGELGPDEAPLSLGGLGIGDRLLLTKPLGTGVVLAADMQGRALGRWVRETHTALVRDNSEAAHTARARGATACTDVSGFGLARHLGEMLSASGTSATIRLGALPVLSGAEALLAAGVRSTFHEQNASLAKSLNISAQARAAATCELLFDPQTSGGLLFAVPEAEVAQVRAELPEAAEIGIVTEPNADGAHFSVEL